MITPKSAANAMITRPARDTVRRSHLGDVGLRASIDGEHSVQLGREQQPLDPLRHVAQDESPAGALGPAMTADEHTETGGVDELDSAEVDEQIVDAGVDGRAKRDPDVTDRRRAEAADKRV